MRPLPDFMDRLRINKKGIQNMKELTRANTKKS